MGECNINISDRFNIEKFSKEIMNFLNLTPDIDMEDRVTLERIVKIARDCIVGGVIVY